MTVLIISPDYVSHYNPLSVMACAASAAGERVVVATGAGLRPRVERDGLEWCHLQLGAASNSGVVADDPAIRSFLAATTDGPLATIRFQAEQRQRDLLWQPERVMAEIGLLLDRLDPDHVLVDHVSFASTLGMYASGRPFTTLVPGHPSQLPVGSERYGVPSVWPVAMRPDDGELSALHELADRVTGAFTERWNRALVASGSAEPEVDDAFRVHGRRVLHNSVPALAATTRIGLLPAGSRFVGPLVRSDARPEQHRSWTERCGRRPQVYVGLGTFLSRRADVLGRIADGLRLADVRAAVAIGPTPIGDLGPLPPDWLVAPTLPQVALLRSADLVIHHGGNNSVQEALAAGARQVAMPFSTDQFANAADLERGGTGRVLEPNTATASDIATAVGAALATAAPPASQPLTETQLANELFSV